MIRGIIFDMDGTITEMNVDFKAVMREAKVPDVPILEYMQNVDDEERQRISEILERHEARAAKTAALKEGVREVLDFLKKKGIKMALLTRNSRHSVETVLKRHRLVFDAVVTREDAPPKPSPEPVRLISDIIGVRPDELLIVGDYIFDVLTGRAAGIKTALLRGIHKNNTGDNPEPDFHLDKLTDLIKIVEKS